MEIVSPNYKNIFTFIFLLLAFICGYNFKQWYAISQGMKEKHISLLYSYSNKEIGIGNFEELLKRELRKQGIDPVFDRFYLDSNKWENESEAEDMIRYLEIIKSKLIDLILSVGDQSTTSLFTCLYDSARNRPIPVAVYQPARSTENAKVIIFNHGYDGNKNSQSNKTYSCLTRPLSRKGYYVISIQHELPNDPLLAMEGDFMKTRMPNWERGVENILFTINEFKKLKPELDWDNLSLLGHSNGGDMTMLFATLHPDIITKAISLDHRRMMIPRIMKPRLYTLRGSDYDADKGVIPTTEEQEKFHIIVIQLNDINHSDMGDKGSEEQHQIMLNHICNFLNH